MKVLTVIVTPFKLDDVRRALAGVGVMGVTVTEVQGCGRQKGHTELYRGAEYTVNFVPKLRIDAAMVDGRVEPAIEAVTRVTSSGNIGDGRIFIQDLKQVCRIRTREAGVGAL